MNQFRLAVYADMRLHAEIPLIAFPGLAHLGIARFRLVLGRGGGADDGGFYNEQALCSDDLFRVALMPSTPDV